MRKLGREEKGRLHLPVLRGGAYQFAAMAENHARIGVAHFERESCRVLEVRQVVAGVAVAQSVERQLLQFRRLPRFQYDGLED